MLQRNCDCRGMGPRSKEKGNTEERQNGVED